MKKLIKVIGQTQIAYKIKDYLINIVKYNLWNTVQVEFIHVRFITLCRQTFDNILIFEFAQH